MQFITIKQFDMEIQEFYKNHAILMLADIPDNISDNDPELNKRMQSIFDKYYLDYKARFAGKGLIERIEGCSFTVPEIDCMQNDCIEEQNSKLTSFDLMTLPPNKRIKVKRYLAFLEAKREVKQPISVKSVKSFPQYLMNLYNKNEQFAEELKKEFYPEKGLEIRYMIEALKKLFLLTYGDRERADLYRSLDKYFNWNIGTKQGIFDKKTADLPKDNIDSSLQRINSIMERLFPVK